MPAKQRFWLLCFIFALGFFLRSFQIGKSPYRGDEAFTVQYWVMQPISQTIRDQLTIDPQPLGAYLAYHYWGMWVGTSEVALRWLPALFNALGIVLVYRLAMQLTQRKFSVALVVATLWAMHPFLIWHAQDVRNYALWSSSSVFSLWMGIRAHQRSTWLNWCAFVVVATLSSYLYYLDFFMLIALFIGMAWNARKQLQTVFMPLIAYIAVGLLLAPWYLQPRLLSGGGYGGTTSGFRLDKLLAYFPNLLAFGFLPSAVPSLWVGIFVWISIGLGLWVLFRTHSKLAWLATSMLTIPILALMGVSLRLNVWEPRYILGIVPVILIVVAHLMIEWMGSKGYVQRVIGVLVAIIWLALNLFSLSYFMGDYTKSHDWKSLARYLKSHTNAENDYVIQTAADAAFGYYYHIAEDVSTLETALPAEPDQPIEDIERMLSDIAKQHSHVWIVAQGFTDWANYGVVEHWMDTHLTKVIDTNVNGLRVQQYRTLPIQPSQRINGINFSNKVILQGYEAILPPQPTAEIYVLLEWHALQGLDANAKTFVHLVNDTTFLNGSPLWRQDDRFVTSIQGESTTIVYRLEQMDGLPQGEYQLLTGWYDASDGTRWRSSDTETAYHVATITVSEIEQEKIFTLR
ncbi:MAG: glycosyltransferase family 39 protein [Phototrophicaceae bacterium]